MLAKAGNAGEVRALEKLYSEDVVIVPAKGDPIVGRARALDESLRASREFKLTVKLSTDATVINSETAYVRGTSHGWKQDRRTGARDEFSQGYTAVLKNYCGNWRVTRLIWN
jgi:ketosteroid isomerase-like protein